MPKICYRSKRFTSASLQVIDQANSIIEEYQSQGFDLTLRQLYYQFVARALISNTQRDYKRIGSIVNDARLAGMINWFAIVDRTRELRGLGHWSSPDSMIESATRGYHIDLWERQSFRPEVWIEKDALLGIFQRACNELDVPFFACRGYTSTTEMWRASQRFLRYIQNDQTPIVLHFGDHDPSGIDMTKDIDKRLDLFTEYHGVKVKRLALNMDQIEQYNPPPNFTKLSDSRAKVYILKYGNDSWELDAMEPNVLAGLVTTEIHEIRDLDIWEEDVERQETDREQLAAVANDWRDIVTYLGF